MKGMPMVQWLQPANVGSATFGRKTFYSMDISLKLNLDFTTVGRMEKKFCNTFYYTD